MVDDSACTRTPDTSEVAVDAGPAKRPALRAVRGPRPIDPAIITALNREYPGWEESDPDPIFAPDGNGGATMASHACLWAVTGPAEVLAEHYPDVPVTFTERGHAVILMIRDAMMWADQMVVPEHLRKFVAGNSTHNVPVTAELHDGITVVSNTAVPILAGTVVGTIHVNIARNRMTPAVRALQEEASAALEAAAPAARTAELRRLEMKHEAEQNRYKGPIPEHILEARRKDREAEDVARDREERAARRLQDAATVTDDGRTLLAGEADLAAIIAGGMKREYPGVFRVANNRHLFYAGKTHSLHAPGGTGKSTLAQAACLSILTEDPDAEVAYLDYEDSPLGVGVRLNALGMTPDLMPRFHYFQFPNEETITALRANKRLALVVIDGLEGALSAFRVPMNGYKEWHDSTALPLATRTGAAVLMLDHPGHGGNRPIGSVFKINAVSGAAYRLDAAGHLYLAGTDGKGKDRPRGLEPVTGPRDLLGQVNLITAGDDDMSLTVTLYPDMTEDTRDTAPTAPLDAWTADTGMTLSRGEVVAVVVALDGGRVAASKVPELVRGLGPLAYKAARKSAWASEAVNAAARSGYIVHPTERATTWVAGSLSEAAAAAVEALTEDPTAAAAAAE